MAWSLLNQYDKTGNMLAQGALTAFAPYAPLVGGLIQGIGAAVTEDPQLAFEKEKEKNRKAESARDFYQNKAVSERQLGLVGLDKLAAMREEAMKNHRRQSFRDAVLGV